MRFIVIIMLLFNVTAVAQEQAQGALCLNPLFEQEIKSTLNFTVPLLSCEQLGNMSDEYILLDARERNEFEISHIPGARYIGYDDFEEELVSDIPKSQKIIVYCSIGYRSEKIGEELKAMGYTDVSNLFGSIFEWVNQGREIIGTDGQPSDTIHTFNKRWSQWIDNPRIRKVW